MDQDGSKAFRLCCAIPLAIFKIIFGSFTSLPNHISNFEVFTGKKINIHAKH